VCVGAGVVAWVEGWLVVGVLGEGQHSSPCQRQQQQTWQRHDRVRALVSSSSSSTRLFVIAGISRAGRCGNTSKQHDSRW